MACESEYSDCASDMAACSAAMAAATMHLASNAPGNRKPKNGAGSTPRAKSLHLAFVLREAWVTCSEADNHVRPTSLAEEKRRAPKLTARCARIPHSWLERAATAAERIEMMGQTRKISVEISGVIPFTASSSMSPGMVSATAPNAAEMPTATGMMAAARSAWAKYISDSAAACSDIAPTCFPRATAALPLYSALAPIMAARAAIEGTSVSTTFSARK
mmetsp:Transcript_126370/g.236171  ORF Transcript_126370/g.236171 Transcript_126370/m.236171 type:complete len:218 (-) Transcript_126370:506-1159(-)